MRKVSKARKTMNRAGLVVLLASGTVICIILLVPHAANFMHGRKIMSLTEAEKAAISAHELAALNIIRQIHAELKSYRETNGNYPNMRGTSKVAAYNSGDLKKDDSWRIGDSYCFDLMLMGGQWWCYAWPLEHGKTGLRSFYVESSGEARSTRLYFEGINRPAKNKDEWEDVTTLENLLSETATP